MPTYWMRGVPRMPVMPVQPVPVTEIWMPWMASTAAHSAKTFITKSVRAWVVATLASTVKPTRVG